MAIFAIHYTYPDDVTEMLTIRPSTASSSPGCRGCSSQGCTNPASTR